MLEHKQSLSAFQINKISLCLKLGILATIILRVLFNILGYAPETLRIRLKPRYDDALLSKIPTSFSHFLEIGDI